MTVFWFHFFSLFPVSGYQDNPITGTELRDTRKTVFLLQQAGTTSAAHTATSGSARSSSEWNEQCLSRSRAHGAQLRNMDLVDKPADCRVQEVSAVLHNPFQEHFGVRPDLAQALCYSHRGQFCYHFCSCVTRLFMQSLRDTAA
ncbi:hypothetical protein lerEdw1_020014 [Lerista edwardsae]|nr:hypothetical protein lerEdw1_020014 [Lerista edwardsae]